MASRYDKEIRAKAVRLVLDHVEDYDSEWAAMCAVSAQLGMSAETLRKWVRQAETDAGQRPEPTSEEGSAEVRELKRKCRELEQTVEILKAATGFFVRESDPLRR